MTEQIIAGEELILVVDDEPELVNLMMRRLVRRGFKVVSAQSEGEALRILDQQKIAAIICDINLGESNGFDLYRKRRAMRGLEPFVYLTGVEEIAHYISEIANDPSCEFLSKPVDFQILMQTLGKTMDAVAEGLGQAVRHQDGA